MGKQLVLVSHGLFCEELKKSTEMIMGPQESIHTVSLLPAESAEDFRAKFEAVIADLDDFVVLGYWCNSLCLLRLRKISL